MNYRPSKTKNSNKYINPISSITSLLIILAIIISTFIITLPVSASDLDDFETAATTDSSQQESDDQQNSDNEDQGHKNKHTNPMAHFFCDLFGDISNEIFTDICNGIGYLVNEGAEMSLARVGVSTDIDPAMIELRQTGEPTLPFFQVDYKYVRVNSEISAFDECFEFGYAPVGFEYRNTYFTKINPNDNLTLTQYHLLLRISGTRSQEFGMGFGMINMRGNGVYSGFSLTFPIKLYPSQSFGIKFKPTYSWINGNRISDHDLSIALTKRFGSLEMGYRFLEVNGENLNGAYIGLALHY